VPFALAIACTDYVAGGNSIAGCQESKRHHSLAQLSYHSARRSTLSLVASHVHTYGGAPYPVENPLCQQQQQQQQGGLMFAGTALPSCSSHLSCSAHTTGFTHSQSNTAYSRIPIGGDDPPLRQPSPPHASAISCLRLGLAGSVTALDALVLSAWHTTSPALFSGG
jgi:hypothetical protein